jgi:hypothetical protein
MEAGFVGLFQALGIIERKLDRTLVLPKKKRMTLLNGVRNQTARSVEKSVGH